MANPESLTGQYLSGRAVDPDPPRGAAEPPPQLKVVGARGNNLKNVDGVEDPARLFTCVTGVSGGGKSTLVNDTLYKALARKLNGAARPRPHDRIDRPRAYRQGHRHRPVADRPHAALQPGDLHRRLHADPRAGSPACPRPRRAATAGPLLVQRQGRPLRGLPGRRRHQDRDALPARRLRALRRLQGQALQPRDARGALQGQDIADVLDMTVEEAPSSSRRAARSRASCKTLSTSASATSGSASQATTLSGGEAQRVKLAKELSEARHRPHALHPRRADHRPALPRRRKLLEGAARAGRRRATRWS
jgi:excinuclease ABC subunit A